MSSKDKISNNSAGNLPTAGNTGGVNIGKSTIKKIKAGKKKLDIKWKKISKAAGYKLQVSKNKKFKKALDTYYVRGTRKKIKRPKEGVYYFRVRAYKSVNNKKIYGKWSKVKKVRIGKKN